MRLRSTVFWAAAAFGGRQPGGLDAALHAARAVAVEKKKDFLGKEGFLEPQERAAGRELKDSRDATDIGALPRGEDASDPIELKLGSKEITDAKRLTTFLGALRRRSTTQPDAVAAQAPDGAAVVDTDAAEAEDVDEFPMYSAVRTVADEARAAQKTNKEILVIAKAAAVGARAAAEETDASLKKVLLFPMVTAVREVVEKALADKHDPDGIETVVKTEIVPAVKGAVVIQTLALKKEAANQDHKRGTVGAGLDAAGVLQAARSAAAKAAAKAWPKPAWSSRLGAIVGAWRPGGRSSSFLTKAVLPDGSTEEEREAPAEGARDSSAMVEARQK
eukprot:g16896.t1